MDKRKLLRPASIVRLVYFGAGKKPKRINAPTKNPGGAGLSAGFRGISITIGPS
jgi:hypothetical protein